MILITRTDGPTPQSEADFRFSVLKRKWHAEEGKYLTSELRRLQDLVVQQEMELETQRQQVAALTKPFTAGPIAISSNSYAPLQCILTLIYLLSLRLDNKVRVRSNSLQNAAVEERADAARAEVQVLQRELESVQEQASGREANVQEQARTPPHY